MAGGNCCVYGLGISGIPVVGNAVPTRLLPLKGKIRRLLVDCVPEGSSQAANAYFQDTVCQTRSDLVKLKVAYNTFLGQKVNKRSDIALICLIDAPRMRLKCAQNGLGALGPNLQILNRYSRISGRRQRQNGWPRLRHASWIK